MTGTHRNTNLKIMIPFVLMNVNCEIILVLVLVNRKNLLRTLSMTADIRGTWSIPRTEIEQTRARSRD